MFSNLKRMVKENNYSSIIFLLEEGTIKLRKRINMYQVILEGSEGFEEHEVSENEFFKYLENAMKSICFSGKYKIYETDKMSAICTFSIKRA